MPRRQDVSTKFQLESSVGAPQGSRRGLEEAFPQIIYSSGPEARPDARQGSEVQHCDGHGQDDDEANFEGPEERKSEVDIHRKEKNSGNIAEQSQSMYKTKGQDSSKSTGMDCKTKGEVRDHDCDDYHGAISHEGNHMKCETDKPKGEQSYRVNGTNDDMECELCCERTQKSWMIKMNKRHIYKNDDEQIRPRKESDERTGVIRSGDILRQTIVRSIRDGTTSDVYDHCSTTHVDCVSSAEGSMEPLKITNEMENDYPWYSVRNIKRWIEAEMRQPDVSWSIDNYGEDSFKVLRLEPLPKEQVGIDMEPREFQELRNKLMVIEDELDELMERKDLDTKTRNRQRKQFIAIVVSVCDDFESTEPFQKETTAALESRTQTWIHEGQAFCVKSWSTTDSDARQDTDQTQRQEAQVGTNLVNCVLKGTITKRQRKTILELEDEESDGEGEKLVYPMTGQSWESFLFPVIIDSGACAFVMPSGWCQLVPLQRILQSEAREFFRAANGNKIYNEGQRDVSMMTREGSWRDMRFIACDVSKALGSVSQMCRTGHSVVFNPPWHEEGSYIQHMGTGERMWLEESNGLYIFNVKVAPKEFQTTMKPGFPGQAFP